MSELAIKVEQLSKSYRIRKGAGGGYTALRDIITERSGSFINDIARGKNPFANRGEYEEFWALKDVSFEVKKGEILGVIGRNGAGKSTLLKLLSRITEPTKGKITLTGRVSSLLEVGTGFHPELTGRENIFLSGAILGMSRFEIKSKFEEIVDFAGVEEFIDMPVKKYSSGMYVRLGFAVSAFLDADILFVDEVLAVGDFEFQNRCTDRIEVIKREGQTIILVSHNLQIIESLCRHTILLDKGHLVGWGETFEMVSKYTYNNKNESKANSPNFNIEFNSGVKYFDYSEDISFSIHSNFNLTDKLFSICIKKFNGEKVVISEKNIKKILKYSIC